MANPEHVEVVKQGTSAILAWQKYLQLDPNGDMADVVSEQIETLSKKPTTTTGSTAPTTTSTTR